MSPHCVAAILAWQVLAGEKAGGGCAEQAATARNVPPAAAARSDPQAVAARSDPQAVPARSDPQPAAVANQMPAQAGGLRHAVIVPEQSNRLSDGGLRGRGERTIDEALLEADAAYLRSLARRRAENAGAGDGRGAEQNAGPADDGSRAEAAEAAGDPRGPVGQPARHYPWLGSRHPRRYYPNWRDLEEAYWLGRRDERDDAERRFNEQDMAGRSERLLKGKEKATLTGVGLMRAGEYSKAVVALTLASKMDQGDPACRIHLAQARMALGHYGEGGEALRRALQLQPKLAFVSLGLRQHYPAADVFDAHVAALSEWSRRNSDPDALLLLGYMEFQRGDYTAAHAALKKARKLGAADRFIGELLDITRPPRVANR